MNRQHHPIIRPTRILRTACGALALVCVAALNTPLAAADSADDVPRSFAPYGDLDLNRPAGIATLRERVRAAAEEVCGAYEVSLRDPGRFRKWNTCVAAAEERAATRVATAIHDALAQRSSACRTCP